MIYYSVIMANYLYPRGRIAIFAKAPIAGTVKTRMTPALRPSECAELQSKLIARSIKTTTQSQLAPVQLWCAPSIQHPAFSQHPVELKQQQGACLGQRMQQAFEDNHKYDFTILIGTDCPLLSIADLSAAAQALQANDVCIGPAHDGGYVLIASREMPKCFENIRWGSDKVLSQSLSALSEAQQSVQLLPPLPDLDHPQDLAALPDNTIQELKARKLRDIARNYLG